MTRLLDSQSMIKKFNNYKPVPRGRVKCQVFDESKAQYTKATPKKKVEDRSEYEIRILTDFSKYFPTLKTVTSMPQFLRLLNMSKDVKEWYVYWTGKNSVDSSSPNWLPSTKEDLEKWEKVKEALAAFKIKEASYSARISVVAKALKEVVEAVAKERKAAISSLDPLIKINRVSVNELEISDQLMLALEADDVKRKAASEIAVTAYQTKLYTAYTGGSFVDPFA